MTNSHWGFTWLEWGFSWQQEVVWDNPWLLTRIGPFWLLRKT